MAGESAQPEPENNDLRSEYDFSDAEVGGHHSRYARGTNIVRLDEGVARAFPTSESVNDALRRYQHIRGVVTKDVG